MSTNQWDSWATWDSRQPPCPFRYGEDRGRTKASWRKWQDPVKVPVYRPPRYFLSLGITIPANPTRIRTPAAASARGLHVGSASATHKTRQKAANIAAPLHETCMMRLSIVFLRASVFRASRHRNDRQLPSDPPPPATATASTDRLKARAPRDFP